MSRITSALVRASTNKHALAREGKQLVERVVSLRKAWQRAAFDLGIALSRLKDKAMIAALGYKTFDAICDVALGISADLANQLIAISKNFSAKQAKTLGTTKAVALVDLARTLPGKHTAAGLLERGSVTIGRRKVNVRAATAHEIAEEARALRAAHPAARRGVHLSAADKHFASALAHALRTRKVTGATVKAIAAGKDTGARVRIEIAMRDATELEEAIHEIVKD